MDDDAGFDDNDFDDDDQVRGHGAPSCNPSYDWNGAILSPIHIDVSCIYIYIYTLYIYIHIQYTYIDLLYIVNYIYIVIHTYINIVVECVR